MSRHQPRRTLLTALLALALTAPAATAETHDLRFKMHTSSLAGTHANTPADVTRALAQERYYSSYGAPAPAVAPAADTADDDGIAPLPFALAMVGALIVGIGATSSMHALARRRRARLA